MAQEHTPAIAGAPASYGQVPPEAAWDLDRLEGETIEQLKGSAQEAFPEPLIQVPDDLRANLAVTSVDALLNWGRRSAVWPVAFGLACCVFEMIASAMSRFDIARFGMEAMRATPRQADLLIVSGTLTWKMAPAVRRIYDQAAGVRAAHPEVEIVDAPYLNDHPLVIRTFLERKDEALSGTGNMNC